MKLTINIYADNVTVVNNNKPDNMVFTNDEEPNNGDDYRAGYNEGYSDALFDNEVNMNDIPDDPNPSITDDHVFPGFGELPPKPADLMNSAAKVPTPVTDHLSASMVVDPSQLKCHHQDGNSKELQQKQKMSMGIVMDAALFNLLFGSGNGVHNEDGTTFRVSGGGVTVH